MSSELKLVRGSWYIKSDNEWEKCDLESAYSDDFIKEINSHIFSASSDYANEIFLYYYVRYREISEVLGDVNRASFSYDATLVDKEFFLKYISGKNIRVGLFKIISISLQAIVVFLVSALACLLLTLLLPVWFFFKVIQKKILSRDELKGYKKLFLVRSKSGYSRVKEFVREDPDCLVVVDDSLGLDVEGISIFSVLRSRSFFSIYWKTLSNVARDFVLIYQDSKELLGSSFFLAVIFDYWKRIPHKALYEACLETLLGHSQAESSIFSCEKEDRFALLQTKCCDRNDRHLTCLPHGLEYGFRFPGGVCGHRFYCFSDYARRLLQSIYNSDKFCYSEDILNKMLGVTPGDSVSSVSRICLFTEPRDPAVNFKIIDALLEIGFEFSIKLHPLEDLAIYRQIYPNLDMINSLDEALRSSICISRKSTVLIESVQRNNVAIAILEDKKDRFYATRLFPSLSSNKIIKAFSFKELNSVITEKMQQVN